MIWKAPLSTYQRSSLPIKISIPFVLVFLGLGTAVIWVLGQNFIAELERKQEKRAASLVALVEREFDKEKYSLRQKARLLASKGDVTQGVATGEHLPLKQALLPLKTILDADVIEVVDSEQQLLFEARSAKFQEIQVQDQLPIEWVLSGSDIATLAMSEAGPVLFGTAPIKTNESIVGGFLLGTAIDGDLLMQINGAVNEQMVVMVGDRVVASTFPAEADLSADVGPLLTRNGDNLLPPTQLTVQAQPFLAQEISLGGEEQEVAVFLLVSRQAIERAKQTLWRFVQGTAILSAALVTALSYWIARRMAQPLQEIAGTAQQVVMDHNFAIQSSVDGKDEIGGLADALNQLIRWVGQYTHELEIAAQTQEIKVAERTQELSDALHELKETQIQLIQTEKLSSLGQMVAGIAHEINNPLSFVQGNLTPLDSYIQDLKDLLAVYQTSYPQPTASVLAKQREIDLEFLLEDLNKLIGSMKMGTQRMRDIVVLLRNYARLDEAAVKDVDIHEGLDGTLLLLNHRIKYGVNVVKDYGALPLIRCSPAQLNQVFTNLITNALDAMFDDKSDPMELVITTQALEGDRIQIRIRDTGPGMSTEVQAKIFDPFFTTKEIGRGTGLGLGICFQIIQHHKGTIEVESDVGQGTEFLITLPTDALLPEPPTTVESATPEEVMASL